jgi:NCS1 family nucleobase:cation symporter-1
VIIVDYFFIKRGNIHTPSLFNPAPGSLYYYTKGWNLKALGCWLAAAAFGIPGLVGAYHPTWVVSAAHHMYQLGWILCFAVASTLYFGSNFVLPARVTPEGHDADPKEFEGFGATEGYLEGDSMIEFRTHEIYVGETDSVASNRIEDIINEKV